jgi:hypothetical protein
VPEVVSSRLHSIILSASIQGAKLSPETYQKAGRALYARDVPANLLSGNTLRIDIELNRVTVPGDGENRELCVIADRVGLNAT